MTVVEERLRRSQSPGLVEAVREARRVDPVQPEARELGIGLVGTGRVARDAHLPAYADAGLRVVAIYDPSEEAMARAQVLAPGARACRSLDELLSDRRVHVVDVATHLGVRSSVIEAALDAGKHVLGQKPFAPSGTEALRLAEKGESLGLKLAANVNGRWAPAWRATTSLIEAGVIGSPFAVSHLYETSFAWTVGTPFDAMPHFGLADYSVHWIDIGLRWLRPRHPLRVWASERRLACQPPESFTPWSVDLTAEVTGGASLSIRGVGGAQGSPSSHPFVVHGDRGSIRGGVLQDTPVVVEVDGTSLQFMPEGTWFPGAFGGSMGELLMAIVEGREPEHAARNSFWTIESTTAAVESAEHGGQPVSLAERQVRRS